MSSTVRSLTESSVRLNQSLLNQKNLKRKQTMLDIGFHLITGMMVGAEYLDMEEVKGFVIDLFIIRITILYSAVSDESAT
jgi:hypothetical protein